jgi:hypothetical protein
MNTIGGIYIYIYNVLEEDKKIFEWNINLE